MVALRRTSPGSFGVFRLQVNRGPDYAVTVARAGNLGTDGKRRLHRVTVSVGTARYPLQGHDGFFVVVVGRFEQVGKGFARYLRAIQFEFPTVDYLFRRGTGLGVVLLVQVHFR